MAPSPELGQPKAPDKVTESRSNTVPDAMTTAVSDSGPHHSQRDQPKLSSSSSVATQQDAENLGNWDEGELKKLLDEAITYKRPKDREHKSETFKELLEHAELEDKTREWFSNRIFSRPPRGSNRHTQGGSLQDLVETIQNEHMPDGDFVIGGQSRRHHHNSRQKKYSSVSTRQREGGSLPSNVNNPYCSLSSGSDDPLLNEFARRKVKDEEKAAYLAGAAAMHDFMLRSGSGGSTYNAQNIPEGKISHTVIEIGDTDADETRHLLAHDSLAQGISDPLSDEGTELNPMKKLPRVPMNYTTHQILNVDVSVGESSRSAHSIDKTVQFSSMLKSSSKHLDVNTVQMNNSYASVNSCMDSKSSPALTLSSSQNGKFSNYSHSIQKHIDENGNSVQTFNSSLPSTSQPNKMKQKNKISKADRNTKTLIAKEIKGNRGDDNIESLLAFIENKETTKRNGVINNSNVQKNVLNTDKNKKKNAGGGKKETTTTAGGNNKLKKSNSMEELKSSSKLEEEIAQSECNQENIVTMRQKNQAKKTADLKENNGQNNNNGKQSKRGERRSWGTEELSYLGDTSNCITKDDDASCKIDKENRKTVKENSKQMKKKEEHSLSIVSIESISTSGETAEFHVVTKKKKAKKRQILEEARQKQQTMHPMNRSNYDQSHQIHSGRGKYQPSHNYTNDRDLYLTSFSSKDNRRKSTSSVPPSEKSDSSDLDSVHSLPVESSTRIANVQQTSTSSGSTPQASYADIARITNSEKNQISTGMPMDKWPVVSNKMSESPDNPNGLPNIATISNFVSKNPMSGNGSRNTIKFLDDSMDIPNMGQTHDTMSSCSSTSSNSTIVKQVTYSQSLTDDKLPPHNFSSPPTTDESTKRTIGLTVNSSKINENSPKIITTTTTTTIGSVVDIAKNPLQKSKSVDNDSYANMTNNEQYPALQKTVKPQKQYQSLPAVELVKTVKTAKTSSSSSTSSHQLNSSSCSVSTTTSTNTTGGAGGTTISATTTNTKKTKQNINNFSNQQMPPPAPPTTTKLNQIELPIETNISIERPLTTDQNSSKIDGNIDFTAVPNSTTIATTTTTTTTKKSNKKDKSSHHSNVNRPAVIILNDNNNHMDSVSPLLFGDFNEEELRLLETESDRQFPSNITYNSIQDTSSNSSQNFDDSTDTGTSSVATGFMSISSSSSSTATITGQPTTNVQISNDTLSSPQSDLGYSSSSQHNRSAMSTESLDTAQSVSILKNIHSTSTSTTTTTTTIAATTSAAAAASSTIYFVPIDNIGTVASNKSVEITNANATATSCGGDQKQQRQQTVNNNEPNNNTLHNNNNNNSSNISSCNSNSNSTNWNHAEEIFNQTAVTAPNWEKLATSEKELNVRYVAPAVAPNINSYNHDKIVNFVGTAWEDIICGANGAQFYNGQ